MSAVCRRMTLADVPQVHAIEERTFATPWSYQSFVDEMTTNKCARYLVAEEDGRVIAYGPTRHVFAQRDVLKRACVAPPQVAALSERLASSADPSFADITEVSDLVNRVKELMARA